jgi:ariadne-1
MEIMQNNGNLSWIEVQFAKEAVNTVVKSRILLKWSYAMAYYLKRNNMTELFEDNQRDLERAVENLSHILESNIAEQDIAKIRLDITNQAAYVQKRHDILLDDTLKGYLEHRWEFTIDV